MSSNEFINYNELVLSASNTIVGLARHNYDKLLNVPSVHERELKENLQDQPWILIGPYNDDDILDWRRSGKKQPCFRS